MLTKRIYSPREMLVWSRVELALFAGLGVAFVVIYDVLGHTWLNLPWLPIALVGTAVAIVLGFQNNATYDRIWEARKIWGGIVNTSRAWGIMVKDFITNDFAEEKVSADELRALHRGLVLRHVAWLTALRHAMRAGRPWEQFLKHQTNREWAARIEVREHRFELDQELEGYLTDEDHRRIADKTNKPAQILALQSEELHGLKTRGLIDDFRHMELAKILVNLYELQGKSERIKNFPYPRQYATLNAVFVWIFVLLLPLGILPEFAEIGHDLGPAFPLIADYFVWLTVPFSVVLMWIFYTMERIGRVGENPFEGSANDVPITTIARGIEIDLREMLGEPRETIPGPIEPKFETQT